ncbi:hypothetical protein KZX62_23345 [Paenibacillus silvae]|uniref:hypothetical protein n=1 Tax=Paenibacillus silvae TaxID=1325358 RepID=UPI002006D934|nr:hypothetical protein [Paenibacillus silvae]MCK6152163.1 hypothetical protein [Paenibacillus silvae]
MDIKANQATNAAKNTTGNAKKGTASNVHEVVPFGSIAFGLYRYYTNYFCKRKHFFSLFIN